MLYILVLSGIYSHPRCKAQLCILNNAVIILLQTQCSCGLLEDAHYMRVCVCVCVSLVYNLLLHFLYRIDMHMIR